jgi:hypothetical protein
MEATTQNEMEPVVRFQPILQAEAQHGPIFRRELFNAAYDAYKCIKDPDPKEKPLLINGRPSTILRDMITLLDIYSKKREASVLRAGHTIEEDGKTYLVRRVWLHSSIHALARTLAMGSPDSLIPYNFGTRHIDVEEGDCFTKEDLQDKTEQWRADWEASKFYCKLTEFLKKHAGHTAERVDQIACFGLGCLPSKWPRHQRRSYIQHLAACTVRDIFAQKQGGAPPVMFTQDPEYCDAAAEHLANHFNMVIMPDPEGFKALNGNTFVITVAPNVPVRQIALGLTWDDGGPVGMMCNSIDSEGLEADGKAECQAYTCESSPALWEYKQKSIYIEYNDGEEEDNFGSMGLYIKSGKDGTVFGDKEVME